jgi:signal transduction histidine kinase
VRERLAYIGGNLQLASRPGRGTDVTLTVPLQSAGAQAAAPMTARDPSLDP